MTLNELKQHIEVWTNKGYGDKQVHVEGGRDQGDYEINCIAKDTNPDIEPNYLFIMLGEKIKYHSQSKE